MCSALLLLCTLACVPTPRGTDTADAGTETGGDSRDSRDSVDTSDSGDSPAGDSDTSETAEDTDTAPEDTGTPAVELNLGEDASAKVVGDLLLDVQQDLQVAGAGDLDNDGLSDIILGSPYYRVAGDHAGRVYLLHGPVDGTVHAPTEAIALTGSAAEGAGSAVDGIGDFNADGYADLIVGAPSYRNGSLGTGAAYIVLGPVLSSGDLSTMAATTLIGEYDEDQYYPSSSTGCSVAGAGDVNGDGFDDVLVGASSQVDGGATYLVSGPVSGEVDLATESTLRVIGTSYSRVAPAGDLNADGYPDILIGRSTTTEALLVFYGPASGSVDTSAADATFAVDSSTYVGTVPGGGGDLDGDGYDDLLPASAGNDLDAYNGGAVWVLPGPLAGDVGVDATVAMVYGQEDYGGLGGSTTALGDLDADGFDDIAIGEPQYLEDGDNPGNTYVLHGPLAGTFPVAYADYVVRGETGDNDMSGTYLAGPGDVDGDGIPDLLIGGPGDDTGGHNAGAAWLVSGALFP